MIIILPCKILNLTMSLLTQDRQCPELGVECRRQNCMKYIYGKFGRSQFQLTSVLTYVISYCFGSLCYTI